MVCNKDCFNCPYPDCVNDEVDLLDVHISEKMDKKLANINPCDRDYRYNHSFKNKIVQKRYRDSEKGKEANRRNVKKYYERHRELKLLYAKEYYAKNKDAINERRRKRDYEKKHGGKYDSKGILATS